MRLRSLLPALGVGLAAWLACMLFYARAEPRAEHEAPSDELARLRHDLDGLRAELAHVRSDTASLRARMRALQAGKDPALELADEQEPSATGAEPDDAPSTPSDATVAYEAEWSGLAQRFASEQPDPRWDPAPELGRKLAAALPAGSSVRALTCRASLCRVETSHRSLPSYQTFTELFGLRVDGPELWSGAASFRVTREPQGPADPLEAVAYLHRAL